MTGPALERTHSQVNRVLLEVSASSLSVLTLFPLDAGSGRYIPGSEPNPAAPMGVADPFTGESMRLLSWPPLSSPTLTPPRPCRWRRLLLSCPPTDQHQHLLPQDGWSDLRPGQRHTDLL